MKAYLPYIAAFVMLAAYYSLVLLGKADASAFVDVLTGSLGGLGVHAVHQGVAAIKGQPNA